MVTARFYITATLRHSGEVERRDTRWEQECNCSQGDWWGSVFLRGKHSTNEVLDLLQVYFFSSSVSSVDLLQVSRGKKPEKDKKREPCNTWHAH